MIILWQKLAESEGEDSQFDSLDNCSESEMSAENYNTLKKVPVAPIKPPLEFQNSPQTTPIRSMSKLNLSVNKLSSSEHSSEENKNNDMNLTNFVEFISTCSSTCMEQHRRQ